MVVVDGQGLPLGGHLHSASPAEVRLAETTLATIRVGRRHHPGRPRQKPERVIADRAYDSDPLRFRLRRRGIELICPYKKNQVRPRKAGANCVGTGVAGPSSAPSPGWATFAAWPCAEIVPSPSTKPFSISPGS
ncbi:MAG: transposase [Acidobacteriia bacterium]|nr:transposase [Terriglobia bacterium]